MSRREVEKVRVKVLRGFQDFEVGSIIDIPKGLYANLSHRKMVELYAAPKALEQVEEKQADANRSVGLKNSEKKPEKRAK